MKHKMKYILIPIILLIASQSYCGEPSVRFKRMDRPQDITSLNNELISINQNMVDNYSEQEIGGAKTFTDPSMPAYFFNLIMPVGFEYQDGVSTTPPAGYNVLFEDGRSLPVASYTALFNHIAAGHGGNGYYFGGSGANFNIPDCRGLGVRGVDMGRGMDTETYRAVGSTQTDTSQGHYHSPLSGKGNFLHGGGGAVFQVGTGLLDSASTTGSPVTDGVNGTPRTSSETRMKNRAVAYFIKY
jgi:phage-related tail fiber protein